MLEHDLWLGLITNNTTTVPATITHFRAVHML